MSKIKLLIVWFVYLCQSIQFVRADYTFLGCFSDPIGNDLIGSTVTFTALDIETCLTACMAYRYFAIQNTYFYIEWFGFIITIRF
jgi:hypothetical protein